MTAQGASIDHSAQHGAVWRRAVLLVLLCIMLAILVSSDALHGELIDVLAASEDVIRRSPGLGAVLFVVFSAASAMFAFVSSAIIVPVAVYTWGEPLSMLLLWLGWMIGGVGTYGIGRFLGRPVVHWLTAHAPLQRFDSRLQRNAPFLLVLLFQLALPSEIPGYVLGLARYRFAKYLFALGLAELPYTLATVHLGAGFVERRSIVILGIGLAIALFSVAAFYVLRKALTRPAGLTQIKADSGDKSHD